MTQYGNENYPRVETCAQLNAIHSKEEKNVHKGFFWSNEATNNGEWNIDNK